MTVLPTVIRAFDEETGERIAASAWIRDNSRNAISVPTTVERVTKDILLWAPEDTEGLTLAIAARAYFPVTRPWPNASPIEVSLSRVGEVVVAANNGVARLMVLIPVDGQSLPDSLLPQQGQIEKRIVVWPAHAQHLNFLLPGKYILRVYDLAGTFVAELPVVVGQWRTEFLTLS